MFRLEYRNKQYKTNNSKSKANNTSEVSQHQQSKSDTKPTKKDFYVVINYKQIKTFVAECWMYTYYKLDSKTGELIDINLFSNHKGQIEERIKKQIKADKLKLDEHQIDLVIQTLMSREFKESNREVKLYSSIDYRKEKY